MSNIVEMALKYQREARIQGFSHAVEYAKLAEKYDKNIVELLEEKLKEMKADNE